MDKVESNLYCKIEAIEMLRSLDRPGVRVAFIESDGNISATEYYVRSTLPNHHKVLQCRTQKETWLAKLSSPGALVGFWFAAVLLWFGTNWYLGFPINYLTIAVCVIGGGLGYILAGDQRLRRLATRLIWFVILPLLALVLTVVACWHYSFGLHDLYVFLNHAQVQMLSIVTCFLYVFGLFFRTTDKTVHDLRGRIYDPLILLWSRAISLIAPIATALLLLSLELLAQARSPYYAPLFHSVVWTAFLLMTVICCNRFVPVLDWLSLKYETIEASFYNYGRDGIRRLRTMTVILTGLFGALTFVEYLFPDLTRQYLQIFRYSGWALFKSFAYLISLPTVGVIFLIIAGSAVVFWLLVARLRKDSLLQRGLPVANNSFYKTRNFVEVCFRWKKLILIIIAIIFIGCLHFLTVKYHQRGQFSGSDAESIDKRISRAIETTLTKYQVRRRLEELGQVVSHQQNAIPLAALALFVFAVLCRSSIQMERSYIGRNKLFDKAKSDFFVGKISKFLKAKTTDAIVLKGLSDQGDDYQPLAERLKYIDLQVRDQSLREITEKLTKILAKSRRNPEWKKQQKQFAGDFGKQLRQQSGALAKWNLLCNYLQDSPLLEKAQEKSYRVSSGQEAKFVWLAQRSRKLRSQLAIDFSESSSASDRIAYAQVDEQWRRWIEEPLYELAGKYHLKESEQYCPLFVAVVGKDANIEQTIKKHFGAEDQGIRTRWTLPTIEDFPSAIEKFRNSADKAKALLLCHRRGVNINEVLNAHLVDVPLQHRFRNVLTITFSDKSTSDENTMNRILENMGYQVTASGRIRSRTTGIIAGIITLLGLFFPLVQRGAVECDQYPAQQLYSPVDAPARAKAPHVRRGDQRPVFRSGFCLVRVFCFAAGHRFLSLSVHRQVMGDQDRRGIVSLQLFVQHSQEPHRTHD